jgi:hypothetical protein
MTLSDVGSFTISCSILGTGRSSLVEVTEVISNSVSTQPDSQMSKAMAAVRREKVRKTKRK